MTCREPIVAGDGGAWTATTGAGAGASDGAGGVGASAAGGASAADGAGAPTWSRRHILGAAAGLVAAPWRATGTVAQVPAADRSTVIAALPLVEKAARLFAVSVAGTALTPEEADWLATWRPAGVTLTGSNIGTNDEVRALVAAIRATNPEHPPFVAVDQEGGPVTRLAGDPAPAPALLGRLPDADVRTFARARAEFLAGFGVDVNFAPVADVSADPGSSVAGRTFGGDPATVARKVAAYVGGVAGTGVAHAAKHFPGHGRTPVDSHAALPTVDLSLDDWRRSDARPFAAAVEAGVPMVMLGHLVYPRWDALPASLSPVAVSVLREGLGFAGAVVTDDLGMGALAAYDPFAVVDLALAAGVDLLLYVVAPAPVEELIGHVVRRVEAGDVPGARLDRSLALIPWPSPASTNG